MRATMAAERDTLPILITPHAALRTKARPVQPADADAVRTLVPRMFEPCTMRRGSASPRRKWASACG